MRLNFSTSPDERSPRKETEILGYAALELAHLLANVRGNVHALDLCTGCGNVVLALAHLISEYEAIATDVTEEAVALAEKNAKKMGLAHRVKFFAGDLFAPVADPDYEHAFDLITCNPPYIASAHTDKMASEISHFEPREAFDGGPFGINLIMRLIREAPKYLKPASWLAFEVGLGQGNSVLRLLEKSTDYQRIDKRTDDDGQIRVLMAQTH